jgi:hypothetical protein
VYVFPAYLLSARRRSQLALLSDLNALCCKEALRVFLRLLLLLRIYTSSLVKSSSVCVYVSIVLSKV